MNKLYLISPPEIELNSFKEDLKAALSTNLIDSFQLRLKNQDSKEVARSVKELLPICHEFGVPFFINDFYELARDYAIDGIHVGQSDENVKILKQEFGTQKIIGVSCMNSRHNAVCAAENGADYVSFGAFFETKTKENTLKADPEILSWWVNNTNIPCAAIGGINIENIQTISAYKPDFICLISAIWNTPQIARAIKDLHSKTLLK